MGDTLHSTQSPHILWAKPILDLQKKILIEQCQSLLLQKIIPRLVIVLVGGESSSLIYTRNKKLFAESLGAQCDILSLPIDVTPEILLSTLEALNTNPLIHGVLIQRPLPQKILHALGMEKIHHLVAAEKDVDGLHPDNMKSLLWKVEDPHFYLSCTPKGILAMINFYQIPLSSAHVVIIGRSLIVGKPLSLLLSQHNATVTLCHSKTKHLSHLTKEADIIISAVGRPKYLHQGYFDPRKKSVVIDVGINKDQAGALCGDADYTNILPYVSHITPVPGGIGPLTVLSLAQNLLKATVRLTHQSLSSHL